MDTNPIAESLRAKFEDRVFNRRFRASIKRTGQGGPFELVSEGCPFKDELCARDEKGNYKDEAVSAMWFGFGIAVDLLAAESKDAATVNPDTIIAAAGRATAGETV